MDKHIIFTNGRSGSNNLVSLLNLHPEITNYGEVLGNWTVIHKFYQRLNQPKDYTQYLDNIYNNKSLFYLAQIYSTYSKITQKIKPNFKLYGQIKTIGVKDFAINFRKRNIPNYLKERDIKIIFLYRKNLLKRAISRFNLRTNKIVKIEENNLEEKNKIRKVYIPTDDLLDELDLFNREQEEQFSMIEGISEERILYLTFEEYFASEQSQQECNDKIFDFLNVKRVLLSSPHKKILPNKLVDVLENYEEVVKAVENTKYEQYLEEN